LAIAGVLFCMPENYVPTARTRLVREPDRAVYDRAAAYQILDEGFICHVGFVVEGQPFVIPTGYGRVGDDLYIHGSAASRMLRNLDQGVAVCVTVTLLEGLVLARSIFNHSMNYRSVVVLGTVVAVQDPTEKLEALRRLSEHILPGRWAESRQPNEKEIKATLVMRLPIAEFSAKVRRGPPIDDEEDYAFPTWAGVIPLNMVAGEPVDDPRLMAGQTVPEYARKYSRSKEKPSPQRHRDTEKT
jgi:nitroimidazol reductase NimA-like FMN-containing flavoprotein (pyridoxamine 5'-phosphate oxidase superfamily)